MRGMKSLAHVAAALSLVSIGPQVEIVQQIASEKPIRRARARGPVKLNRSRHWDYAETYKEARLISPFPHIPVR